MTDSPSSPSTGAGYSGTPLWKKLGVKPGLLLLTDAAPPHYPGLLAGRPDDARLAPLASIAPDAPIEFLHMFVVEFAALEVLIRRALPRLAAKGVMWVSWPKKTSPLSRGLGEDDIRTVALPLGLVDIKVCAVDVDWSGLKLVRRKAG